ncbi:hypothetical protein ACJBSW_11200, partial [Streptococcus suis]
YKYLKKEFDKKDIGETKLCLCLLLDLCAYGILVHHNKYAKNMIRKYNFGQIYSLITLLVIRLLNMTKDPFRLKEKI